MFTPWECAHGEAAPAWLTVAPIVALAPADDSVDTNSVVIEGAGTIESFGDCPHVVMKRVRFVPLVLAITNEPRPAPGAAITLVNSMVLNLLGKKDRAIAGVSFGMYQCDGGDHWTEIYFATQGAALVNELEQRIADLESRLAAMES
jgi:hypothetical protein